MPFGASHRIILRLAKWGLYSFFHEIHVVGEENVPKDGPVIIACTHHNMMIDPAVLSSTFPHKRYVHYWAKSSLFKHPVAKFVLTDAGNIPVDRGNKDNRVLFRGTFDALAAGEVVGLFPEGTSYTEPRIMQVKDGAAWAALEYGKWMKDVKGEHNGNPVVVVPVGITYTNKSKYRSAAIIEYGEPITMDAYVEQFNSGEEGAPRAAVKRLTHQIELKMMQSTVNAPDWDTLYAARMARELLWEDERSIDLEHFVTISQTLADLFSTSIPGQEYANLKKLLLTYSSLLKSTRLTNSALSGLPLPRTLDPSRPAPFPSRLSTVSILLRDSLASLIRLPFFLFPLIVHAPAYLFSRYAAQLVEHEEESQAQSKVVIGLLLLSLIYSTMFFFLWALLWLTPVGGVIAAGIVWLFAVYHVKLIDDNYEHAKRLIAAWRVLVGVWTPKRWDLSLAALKPYTTPIPPPANPWIKRPTTPGAPPAPAPAPETKPVKRHRPPTRRIIRHVLRARLDASRALAAFLTDIERSNRRVRASAHLAQQFGGQIDEEPVGVETNTGVAVPEGQPRGWRNAKEVVGYLRAKGARIANLGEKREGDWAAASSEGEGEEKEDLVWVSGSNGQSGSD